MLHVVQELRRAVCVRGDDDLFGGVDVMVKARRPLSPAGMAGADLEPAPLKRRELVHLVQLVDLDAEFLCQVEVIRRQLVLGVVPAAVVAVTAGDTSGPPGSGTAEVRVVGLDARAAEVDAHRSLIERFTSTHLGRDLMHVPVHIGGQVGVADDAEHPPRLVDVRSQFVGPVRDARPFRRIEKLPRRDVQRVGVDMRAAADARAAQDEHVVEVLDPLDPVQLGGGKPQETRQVPLSLRDVLVAPASAGFHDADPVALLRRAERGDAAAEPRADDQHVVVEARHELCPF